MATIAPPIPTSLTPTSTVVASMSPTATIVPDHPHWQHVTSFGTTVLWVVFAIQLLASAGFIFLAWRTPVKNRLFHQVTTYITIIAAISYYAMASGAGYSYKTHHVTHKHKHDIPDTHEEYHRQVYYARYVDWLFTTPLLLLDLALLAGLNGANIINVIVADIIMIVTGLFAAYARSTQQKWGWYVISWIGFLVIISQLAINGRATATKRGGNVQKLYVPLAVYTVSLWFAYPIIWALSEGNNSLSVNKEVLAYAILDVLAKPVFGAWLLITHSRAPEISVSLDGIWANGFGQREGTLRVGDDDEA